MNSTSDDNEESVPTILEFLKAGDEFVKFAPNQDVVLALGNTGSGKSTFVQYIAGYDSNLISKEVKDMGEYIIEDTGGRISNSTLVSKTIFPELIMDSIQAISYYDCPGFSDTRSAKYDIASTYFIKRVIDESKSVKFLFVVGYPAVQHGVDRQDFKLLVKHATTLIKDVDKYKDSIALIVAKVPNQYKKNGNQFILVKDHVVIEAIVDFIKQAKADLENKPNNKNSITFMDALLTKRGHEYLKIGIFRRPDEPGLVSEIQSLQTGKSLLRRIIQENIKFTMKDKEDFGYTISADSILRTHDLIGVIYKSLTADIFNVGKDIENEYKFFEMQPRNITALHVKFINGYNNLFKIKTEIVDRNLEPQESIEKIYAEFKISTKNLISVLNQDKYLKFLRDVSNNYKTVSALEWTRNLIGTLEYLKSSANWYRFLLKLYEVLSLYENQRNITKLDTSVVMVQTIFAGNESKQVENIGLTKLLNDVSGRFDVEYNDVKNIEIDVLKAQLLRKVLYRTVTYETAAFCPTSNKLVTKAPFVKISDIPKYLKQCPEQIKFIEILALNKIFIDSDLDLTGTQTQLTVVAPTWEVIGKRNILLDGKSGNEHEERKARNGFGPGDRGVNGKPGAPGGPAGTFFGIGLNFINGEQLTISANGGKGALGQEGGNGAEGKNGKTPTVTKLSDKGSWEGDGFTVVKKQVLRDYIGFGGRTCNVYIISTENNGQEGGDGGDGGRGGEGGSEGSITILGLQQTPNVKHYTHVGENGDHGAGGLGGHGGKHSPTYTADSCIHQSVAQFFPSWDFQVVDIKDCGTADSGKNGLKGHNANGTIKPEKAVSLINPSHTLNYYKNYLRKDLTSNIINPSDLEEFLKQIEKSKFVESLYDTIGFLHELQSLEDQYLILHKGVSHAGLYRSLLERLEKYAREPKDHEKTPECKKVLSYLYAATLSKICSLTHDLESNLVINVKGFLDLAIDNIKKLKELDSKVAIDEYQQGYKDVINSKIAEATQLIENEITPEISKIFDQIDNKIQELVDEIIDLQKSAENQKEKLLQKQQDLEKKMQLQKILGGISTVGQFLSVLGPVGAGVSSVTEGVTSIANSLALDNRDDGLEKLLAFPVAVKSSFSKLSDSLKNKQQLLSNQLDDVEDKIQKFTQNESLLNSADIMKRVKATKKQLREEILKDHTFDPATLDRIYSIRQEMKQMKSLEQQKPKENIKIRKQLNFVNHLKNVVNLDRLPPYYYMNIKDHRVKIDKIAETIGKTNEKIKQLELDEENVYKVLVPVFRNIQKDVENVQNSLHHKTHSALHVSKWEIQTTIRAMKLKIKRLTESYSVQDDLEHCIEKLLDGMTTMINVYDRIEDYNDKAKLASYMADINSNRALSIKINKEELRVALNSLNLIIKSNLVLTQYEKAMKAFKQYIFPFAHSFLDQYYLPQNLRVDNSTDNLIFAAVQKIEDLRRKLATSSVTIDKYQKYIYSNKRFDSRNTITSPFFIWRTNDNKNTIKQLLEGEKVTIYADVTKFNAEKNAVKFNVIEINFKMENETVQRAFDKQLEDFQVTLIHLGNSYYRCGHKFFVINSDNQTITYSFKKDENGEPLSKNNVYSKIKNNDSMLSPYALWTIKLTGISNNFSALEKYKHQVIHLELNGRGQYVSDEREEICENNLEQYYTIDASLQDNIQEHLKEFEMGHKRRRRAAKDSVLREPFVTSGASSTAKSSLIGDLFRFITSGASKLTYLDPFNQVEKYFTNKNAHIGFKLQTSDLHTIPIQTADITNQFIDEEPFTRHTKDVNLLNPHSNLLLCNLLVRKVTGVKLIGSDENFRRNKSQYLYAQNDNSFGSDLAYRYYKNNL